MHAPILGERVNKTLCSRLSHNLEHAHFVVALLMKLGHAIQFVPFGSMIDEWPRHCSTNRIRAIGIGGKVSGIRFICHDCSAHWPWSSSALASIIFGCSSKPLFTEVTDRGFVLEHCWQTVQWDWSTKGLEHFNSSGCPPKCSLALTSVWQCVKVPGPVCA